MKFTINPVSGALSFLSAPDYESPVDADGNNVYVVQVTANDGAGNTTSQTISATVTPVNEGPVNHFPVAQSVILNTTLVFGSDHGNALSVTDVDDGGNTARVTLSVSHGTLTLSGTTGLVFTDGNGTGDTGMTFEGTLSEINAALAGLSANGGGYLAGYPEHHEQRPGQHRDRRRSHRLRHGRHQRRRGSGPLSNRSEQWRRDREPNRGCKLCH